VACDFETTGLHPAYHHRVVEAAFVTGVGNAIEAEWTSLICPDRDIGAGEIHDLYGRDLVGAPRFELTRRSSKTRSRSSMYAARSTSNASCIGRARATVRM